jgi:hypothetical protein
MYRIKFVKYFDISYKNTIFTLEFKIHWLANANE